MFRHVRPTRLSNFETLKPMSSWVAMHFEVMLDQTKIVYEDIGLGETLVLLHGYGASPMHWNGIVNELKSSFRLIVPNFQHVYLHRYNRLTF